MAKVLFRDINTLETSLQRCGPLLGGSGRFFKKNSKDAKLKLCLRFKK